MQPHSLAGTAGAEPIPFRFRIKQAERRDLVARLGAALPGMSVESTASAGLDPDWVEAVAFAWLAMRTSEGLPGNLPSVTGAAERTVLGTRHPAG